MRRILRRAAEAGARTCTVEPTPQRLAAVVELARMTAAKQGNPEYLRAESFVQFVVALGELAVVTEVRVDEELVAAGVCLRDAERVYIWVHGARYETIGSYSPSYLLWAHELGMAIERGARVAECGRGSETFKRRYGMRPMPLYACVVRRS
jgi:CelD/BcsL family acetyltransferase involved in cellulose biosynthesis